MTSRDRGLAVLGYGAVLAAVAALLLFWAVITPPLSTVDEPVHFNSVLRLMQGGGWPPPQSARFLEGTFVALREAGSPYAGTVPLASLPDPADRSVVTGLTGFGLDGVNAVDWMTQHPPTYYGLVAGILTVFGAAHWRWDELVMGVRVVSIIFVAGGVAFVLASVRRVTSSTAATILGGLAILTVPQFFNVLSLITNDSLTVLAGSGLIYFLVRSLSTADPDWRSGVTNAVGAGAFLGLGLLTKGTMLTTIPAVLLALVVAGIRTRGSWLRRLAPAAMAMVVAFSVGGWWWLRNILVFGEIQSSNSGTGRDPEPFDEYDLGRFVRLVSWQLVRTFWGSIRPVLGLPRWTLVVFALGFAVALIYALSRSKSRLIIGMIALIPVLTGALITFHAWEVFWNTGRIVGIQGRYFFPAITAYALVLALCWQISAERRRGATRLVTVLLAGATASAVAAGGFAFAYGRRWGSVTDGWAAMSHAGPFDPAFVVMILLTVGAATVTAVACAARATVFDSVGVDETIRGRVG